MNYPKVSFETKAVVTLKTFSSRNALPGRAAHAVEERTMVCVMPADWGPIPWRSESSRRADGEAWADCEGARPAAQNLPIFFSTSETKRRIEAKKRRLGNQAIAQ
jgi:hypothetical protein